MIKIKNTNSIIDDIQEEIELKQTQMVKKMYELNVFINTNVIKDLIQMGQLIKSNDCRIIDYIENFKNNIVLRTELIQNLFSIVDLLENIRKNLISLETNHDKIIS